MLCNYPQFDPERFHRDRQDKIPKFTYLPFSGGPRICIGNAFALDANANQFGNNFAKLSAHGRPWISVRDILQLQYSSQKWITDDCRSQMRPGK
jgi:hypothetical protein